MDCEVCGGTRKRDCPGCTKTREKLGRPVYCARCKGKGWVRCPACEKE